ncbi:MAG: hypothetical protein M1817_000101 [Caeruleum heppii]|nr:MAG: hypothetical protein M1817_000101 [Caeruleum heppii]
MCGSIDPFLENQISPLYINTTDGQSLYVWHILPLGLYARYEEKLLEQAEGPAVDFTQTQAFRLLAKDPEARLNAGTVAQGWRTDTYRALSSGATEKIHVLAFDYRGFGYSSGSPTEEGIIADAIAVIDWVLEVAQIPPERIVLLGQSLGTAVTVAAADHYAVRTHQPAFAGIVLVAGFSDIPSLLLTYSIGGVLPILSPLRPYPRLQRVFAGFIRDTWHTANRLHSLIRNSKAIRLYLIHAKDDFNIPWRHTETLFHVAANATSSESLNVKQIDATKKTRELGGAGYITTWDVGGERIIRQHIVYHGGHNRVVTYGTVALTVFKAFSIPGASEKSFDLSFDW